MNHFPGEDFLPPVSRATISTFSTFVRETFRVRIGNRKIAIDAFDQTHYEFRHNAMVRPAPRKSINNVGQIHAAADLQAGLH
jgi:hypothetical protein